MEARTELAVKSKKMWNKLPRKGKFIVLGVIAAIILLVCLGIWLSVIHQDEPSTDTTYMVALLEESSELTTAKLNYTGMTEYHDTGIAIINKADFIMVYDATARIGIDVKEVLITPDDINKVIRVIVPKAKVQDVHVNADSIKYFDEDFALFNANEKEDGNKAIALAEEEARKKVETLGVLEMANDQAETLLKGILAEAIPKGYTLEFTHK